MCLLHAACATVRIGIHWMLREVAFTWRSTGADATKAAPHPTPSPYFLESVTSVGKFRRLPILVHKGFLIRALAIKCTPERLLSWRPEYRLHSKLASAVTWLGANLPPILTGTLNLFPPCANLNIHMMRCSLMNMNVYYLTVFHVNASSSCGSRPPCLRYCAILQHGVFAYCLFR